MKLSLSLLFIVISTQLLCTEASSWSTRRELLGTRNTIDNKKTSDRICAYENGECHWEDYIKVLAYEAAPGIVLAVLCLLAFVVYIIFHCVACVCCGCFKGITPPPQGSKRFYWATMIILWISTAGIVVCTVVALFTGNKQVENGMKSTVGSIIDTGSELLSRIEDVGAALASLEYTKDYAGQVQQIEQTANQFLDTGKSYQDTVNHYNHIRYLVYIGIFTLAALLPFIASFSAAFNWTLATFSCGLACFFASFLIWLVFGIHSTVDVVSKDVCVEMRLLKTNESVLNSLSSDISQLVECETGDPFRDIREYIYNASNTAFTKACEKVDDMCDEDGVTCENTGNCTKSTLPNTRYAIISEPVLGCQLNTSQCPYNSSITDCPADMVYECGRHNVTFEQCQTQCYSSHLRDLSSEAIKNLDLMLQYNYLIEQKVIPLLSCSFVKSKWNAIESSLCKDVRNGSNRITILSGVIGALLVFSTIAALLGWRLFRKPVLEDEMEPTEVEDRYRERYRMSYVSRSTTPNSETNLMDPYQSNQSNQSTPASDRKSPLWYHQ